VDRELLNRRRTLDDLRARFEADPAAAPLHEDLRRSWARCAPVLPVHLTAAPLAAGEVRDRWDDSLIRRAAPDLPQQLQRVAEDGDFVAAITDETGRILWSSGGRTMSRRAEQVNFVAGGCWDERSAGTNAPGLALITGAPATVFSVEHWCEAVHEWVCYAAPVHAPDGTSIGVIDLSANWRRHSPLALTTVTSIARLVELQLPAAALDAPALRANLLGNPSVVVDGMPVTLPLRQLEILAVLVDGGDVGFDALHDRLYGERPISAATLKAEISHLRRQLDGRISSRPYRLEVTHDVDFLRLLDDLRRGNLHGALRRYRGQLLPGSESPFVVARRHEIDAALRAAVLRHGSAADLVAFADLHPWDVAVLDRAAHVVGRADPLAAVIDARRQVLADT
jgi:hypothetical protein